MTDRNMIVLGSCRLGGIPKASYIHEVNHVHNSKEAIQYINFIKGNFHIPSKMHKYVFRGCFLNNDFMIDRKRLSSEFNEADVVFVEICSRKKYLKNGYYIHHLAADKGDAPVNNLQEHDYVCSDYELFIQTKDELERDILELAKILHGKYLVIVTHNGYGIDIREQLIENVEDICGKHDIICINPSSFSGLKNEMSDSNHYTVQGLQLVTSYILGEVMAIGDK